MKHVTKLTLFFIVALLVALAFPGRASAANLGEDKVIFGDTYRLGAGETLSGNLVVLGGAVTLGEDSTVTGDVALMGGALEINGSINGNLNIVGGSVSLGDTAVVHGDISSMGGTLRQSENARVDGRTIYGKWSPFSIVFPKGWFQPNEWIKTTPSNNAAGTLGNALLLAALSMLVMLFIPKPAERVAQAVMAQPIITGGLGLLSMVVVPVLLVLTAITIIGIPITLAGAMVFAAAILFGWMALGIEAGRRISAALKLQLHPALVAGMGTLALTLVVNGISSVVWCIGWLAPFLVALLSLGGVVITRFGRIDYTPPAAASTVMVTPVTQVTPEPPAGMEIPSTDGTPAPPPQN
jgi:cytoskeletal protein CcmA (bactofilin family)